MHSDQKHTKPRKDQIKKTSTVEILHRPLRTLSAERDLKSRTQNLHCSNPKPQPKSDQNQ